MESFIIKNPNMTNNEYYNKNYIGIELFIYKQTQIRQQQIL